MTCAFLHGTSGNDVLHVSKGAVAVLMGKVHPCMDAANGMHFPALQGKAAGKLGQNTREDALKLLWLYPGQGKQACQEHVSREP